MIANFAVMEVLQSIGVFVLVSVAVFFLTRRFISQFSSSGSSCEVDCGGCSTLDVNKIAAQYEAAKNKT